jgi:hypothetical protein
MTVTETFKWMAEHWETLSAIVIALLTTYRAYQEKLSGIEALKLVINVFKDEGKKDGELPLHAEKTIEKVILVAHQLETPTKAVEAVKTAVSDVNESAKDDTKIGSYKGKPIYLGSVLSIADKVRTLWGVFHGK